MAPSTPDEAHLELLEKLNQTDLPAPFFNSDWRPSQRRNKTVTQMISEDSRREASLLATQNNSGAITPLAGSHTTATPSNIAQAAQNLSTLVLERNLANAMTQGPMPPTYMNIEAAPSTKPKKKYCDITGLPAPYTDPKTGLRYFNKEIYGFIQSLTPGQVQQYLELRGAHTVLK